MPTALEQLQKHTIVVADTGDIEAIQKVQPTDATTNPSLIYKAATMEAYQKLIDDAVESGEDLEGVMDQVAVNFGTEISKIVPGYISTEVDARLSFDTDATMTKARKIIDLYKQKGIDKSRILIKIAATWEGIQAAMQLEQEGIACNLTLVFSLVQAVACAQAGVTLISPFVGRIMDWYKKSQGVDGYIPTDDPGVQSVTQIYHYYKKFGYTTIVMGASFRNMDEILQLVGCDRLTIAPKFLEALSKSNDTVTQHLNASESPLQDIAKLPELTESTFRWMLNEDAMATEKLAEGIRNFAKDIVKLEEILAAKLTK